MARGKEAAQAANRRWCDAETRLAELQRTIARERQVHSVEMQNMRAERDQARSRLASEVDRQSREQVLAARARAEEEVARVVEACELRILAGFQVVVSNIGGLPTQGMRGWEEGGSDDVYRLSVAFGVAVGRLLEACEENFARSVRRVTDKHAKKINEVMRKARN